MSRKDFLVLAVWCAAVLALLAPVWARSGAVFFNHGDLYTYHVPLRSITALALQRGRLPFWNPFILLGLPHAANPQAALFYPPATATFFWPVARALMWDQVFHLLWAGVGMFLLARASRLDRAGAAILASSFALSPFLVYRVTEGIPTLLAALAWAPWVWLAWLAGGPGLLAAAFALQLLSGHGQFLLVNVVGMALWALCRADRRALLRRMAVAGAGGAALTCVQWVLTAPFLGRSVRSGWAGAASGLYALTPASLLTWLHPGALGTPLDGHWPGPLSEFYETCAGNAGLVALGLAAVGLARGRRRLAAAGLGLVGLALSFGPADAPLRLILTLPVLSYLRTPARWLFLALWAVLLLAGAALARLDAPRARGVKAALALAAFLLLAAWDAAFLAPQDPGPFLAPNRSVADAAGGRPFRVLTDPELANPNKAALYRMRNVNGYEAFYLAGVPAWARSVEGSPAADASRVYVSRWPSEALAQAGVAARLSVAGLEWQKFRPLVFFIDAAGHRLDAPMIKIFAEEPERWRILAIPPLEAAGVVFLDPAYPGWRAWEDGRPLEVLPWGGLFQAVALPAIRAPGVKTAFTFDFRPTFWTALVALTAAAWAAWLALALRRAEAA
jgi:hypothetical protein